MITLNGATFSGPGAVGQALNSLQTQDLETVRAWALVILDNIDDSKERAIDALLTRKPGKSFFLGFEIYDYFNAGRPADPAAGRYAVADEMATRRGITLRAMLEILLTRWQTARAQVAADSADFDAATTAIEGASTIAEIQTILEGVAG